MLALAIMGVGALVIWYGIGRNVLQAANFDRLTEASRKIMAGDCRSACLSAVRATSSTACRIR